MDVLGHEVNEQYIVREFFAGRLPGPDTAYRLPNPYWCGKRTQRLTERKEEALCAFYNEDGSLKSRKLKDVAAELGVTPARARGLQDEALTVLGIRYLKQCGIMETAQ